jgi:hypothetical protein
VHGKRGWTAQDSAVLSSTNSFFPQVTQSGSAAPARGVCGSGGLVRFLLV